MQAISQELKTRLEKLMEAVADSHKFTGDLIGKDKALWEEFAPLTKRIADCEVAIHALLDEQDVEDMKVAV